MEDFIPSWTYKYDLYENRQHYLDQINKVFNSGRLLFGNELKISKLNLLIILE